MTNLSNQLNTDDLRKPHLPLAARLRPNNLDEVVVHQSLLAKGNSAGRSLKGVEKVSQGILRRFITEKNLPSMIFWVRQAVVRPA